MTGINSDTPGVKQSLALSSVKLPGDTIQENLKGEPSSLTVRNINQFSILISGGYSSTLSFRNYLTAKAGLILEPLQP